MSRKIYCSVALTVSALLLSAEPKSVHAADAAADSSDSGALQEVIVTARRREESAQNTPVSVSSVAVAALEAKNAVNLGDLQGAVPNLLITSQNSGAATANLSMRGLTFADVEKSFDPTVAVVVDGIFLGTSTGQFMDFFDVGDLEVLRGPQGTLFGRNTIGGVINITRTRPTGELGGKMELTYGRFGDVTARGVFNTPITDSLAAKLFYFDTRSDGFYHNGITGQEVGGNHNQNFGAALLFAPRDTGFDALLTLEKQIQRFDVVNSNLTASTDAFGALEQPIALNRNTTNDLYTVYNTPGAGEYRAPAATLQMNQSLGGVKLVSITGYRKSDEDQTQDFDAASMALLPALSFLAPLYYTHRLQSFHQFSEELRASGNIIDTLDYVVGAYYYDSAYKLTQYTNITGSGYGPPQVVSGTARSVAGFADFDWQFYDKWRLNFGGRYTQDRKTLDNYDPTFLGAPSATFGKFTPKVGVDYRPTQNYMVYASWSVGERSGGFSNRAATVQSTNTPFKPETVDSAEVGVKTTLFDNRVTANVAYFDAKYKDMQQNTTIPGGPTGNQTIVTNVGSAVIRGVEVELSARATQQLTFNGSLGTLSSHFNGFITDAPVNGVLTPFDYSQNNLIYNPSITLALGADYKVPVSFGEFHANLGWRHIASYDQQISLGPTTVAADGTIIVHGNDPRVRADPQNIVDASLTTAFQLSRVRAHVTLYGRNLTNDLGPTAAFTVAGLFAFASAREPRNYGVTLGLDF